LLADYENFQEAFDQGMQGDCSALDMTIGDVYGEGCSTMGLIPQIPASCMGKAQHFEKEEIDKLDKKDIAKSLILMFCINLGMMTNLVADSVPGVNTVVVLGFPHLGFQTLLSVSI
jgi:pantothenate kinase